MTSGGVAQAVDARLTVPARSDEALPPDLERLLRMAEATWSISGSVHAGAGYKDNLLLSHSNPEHSAFVRGGVENLVWRLPRGGVDYFGFVNAEGTHYATGHSLRNEGQAFAGIELRYRFEDRLTATLDVNGYYLDQVFDISDTDIQRVVAELKVHGARIGPTLRWSIKPWWWVESSAKVSRELFQLAANDARVRQAECATGVKPTSWLELSVHGSDMRRAFDTRTRYDDTGRPTSGLLVVHERELEGRVAATWGKAGHWRTTSAAGRLDYRDNGVGYLNYRQRHVRQEVQWSAGAWSVQASGEARRKDYELQTVGRGVVPLPAQLKDEYTARLRVERKVADHWTLFAEMSWERLRSNESLDSYEMKEGLLGVQWSWEK